MTKHRQEDLLWTKYKSKAIRIQDKLRCMPSKSSEPRYVNKKIYIIQYDELYIIDKLLWIHKRLENFVYKAFHVSDEKSILREGHPQSLKDLSLYE